MIKISVQKNKITAYIQINRLELSLSYITRVYPISQILLFERLNIGHKMKLVCQTEKNYVIHVLDSKISPKKYLQY